MSYERPEDMPGRVCRVLEGMMLLDMEPVRGSFTDLVYRFTHISSSHCPNPHDDWVEEFLKAEAVVEEEAYTSPVLTTKVLPVDTGGIAQKVAGGRHQPRDGNLADYPRWARPSWLGCDTNADYHT